MFKHVFTNSIQYVVAYHTYFSAFCHYCTIHILKIYLPYSLHEHRHHLITIDSQYEHDHSYMTNVKVYLHAVLITII